MAFMGLDVGTTECKAAVFSPDGTRLAMAYREYPTRSPHPGWLELEAEHVWSQVTAAIREVAVPEIEALAVSALGEAVLPVDHSLRALAPSILGFEARGREEALELERRVGTVRLRTITGQPQPHHPSYSINKILWWKRHRPDMYDWTWKFLCYEDYILAKLGADPTIDPSLAARTLAYDIHAEAWSPEILAAAGISAEQLSIIAPSGTDVGRIAPDIAAELGLPTTVRLVTGGHDQPCGALGAGVVDSGMAMDATGTVECICTAVEHFHPKLPESGFSCYPHVVPGVFVTLAYNFTGGAALRWYRDTLGTTEVDQAQQEGRDPYDVILAGLPIEPTGLIVLPHFAGTGTPWMDGASRGALLGLTYRATKQDIVLGLLEGVTYELALNLRLLRATGAAPSYLRAIGGGAKSTRWLQLKADIFGIPVETLAETEAGCLGAALLAAAGVGAVSAAAAAGRAAAQRRRVYEPQPDIHARYARLLDVYARVYPALRDINRELTDLIDIDPKNGEEATDVERADRA